MVVCWIDAFADCTTAAVQQTNANSFTNCGTAHGTVCTASCNTFYSGSKQATCSRGTWTYSGTCARESLERCRHVGCHPDFCIMQPLCLALGSDIILDALRRECAHSKHASKPPQTPRCLLCLLAVAPVPAVTNCTAAPTTNTTVATAYVCPRKNSLSGDVCSAACLSGYSGSLTATCNTGIWAYSGACNANGERDAMHAGTYTLSPLFSVCVSDCCLMPSVGQGTIMLELHTCSCCGRSSFRMHTYQL
jgi:hypothetical protein